MMVKGKIRNLFYFIELPYIMEIDNRINAIVARNTKKIQEKCENPILNRVAKIER